MKRRFRLTKNLDFKRVRKSGRTFAHPLLVLIQASNDCKISRVGIITSRSLGNAVKRNRIKRMIRDIMSGFLPDITGNWDMVFIPKRDSIGKDHATIKDSIMELLVRAKMVNPTP